MSSPARRVLTLAETSVETRAARITHYYGAIGVASLEMEATLTVGDTVHIRGHTTDFEQEVKSLQKDHQDIARAVKGEVAGLKVNDYVRENDIVYRIVETESFLPHGNCIKNTIIA